MKIRIPFTLTFKEEKENMIDLKKITTILFSMETLPRNISQEIYVQGFVKKREYTRHNTIQLTCLQMKLDCKEAEIKKVFLKNSLFLKKKLKELSTAVSIVVSSPFTVG